MNVTRPLAMLGGLTPRRFMQNHWQKKPLLVRQAVAGLRPLLSRSELFGLASSDAVESRLVVRDGEAWELARGPFGRRALPPVTRPDWTLLVQGVDLHVDAARALLRQFAFIPAARLDDLMISYATDGGGVGPHFDSYDVFLLQAHGRRRWRIGRQRELRLREDVPLKILADFRPEEEHVLEPGDMLYLPPRYAHDGVAEGECQTYSIGFRAPARAELGRELLQRMADAADAADEPARLYADAAQSATGRPGAMPRALQQFAAQAVADLLRDVQATPRALGEYLTEPKPDVWFEAAVAPARLGAVALDRRTRMLYDRAHVFVNGESWRAGGADAVLMRRLADEGRLAAADVRGASAEARALLRDWLAAGWIVSQGATR